MVLLIKRMKCINIEWFRLYICIIAGLVPYMAYMVYYENLYAEDNA